MTRKEEYTWLIVVSEGLLLYLEKYKSIYYFQKYLLGTSFVSETKLRNGGLLRCREMIKLI